MNNRGFQGTATRAMQRPQIDQSKKRPELVYNNSSPQPQNSSPSGQVNDGFDINHYDSAK